MPGAATKAALVAGRITRVSPPTRSSPKAVIVDDDDNDAEADVATQQAISDNIYAFDDYSDGDLEVIHHSDPRPIAAPTLLAGTPSSPAVAPVSFNADLSNHVRSSSSADPAAKRPLSSPGAASGGMDLDEEFYRAQEARMDDDDIGMFVDATDSSPLGRTSSLPADTTSMSLNTSTGKTQQPASGSIGSQSAPVGSQIHPLVDLCLFADANGFPKASFASAREVRIRVTVIEYGSLQTDLSCSLLVEQRPLAPGTKSGSSFFRLFVPPVLFETALYTDAATFARVMSGLGEEDAVVDEEAVDVQEVPQTIQLEQARLYTALTQIQERLSSASGPVILRCRLRSDVPSAVQADVEADATFASGNDSGCGSNECRISRPVALDILELPFV
jgi:hypothetical protein